MSSNVQKFLEEIRVYDCSALTKIRIGEPGDGGYVVARELCEKTPVLYSFSAENDVKFEQAFMEAFPGTKMQLHDPMVIKLREEDRRLSFERLGIGSKYPKLIGVIPWSFLKMDIEWDEWATLLNFDAREFNLFSQIVVEFHIAHVIPALEGLTPYFRSFYQSVADKLNEDLFAMYRAVMEQMNRVFVCFHIHANNSLPAMKVNGNIFPPLLELSFVRRDLAGEVKLTEQEFPVPGLDTPNKIDRPDIIRYYPFVPVQEEVAL